MERRQADLLEESFCRGETYSEVEFDIYLFTF